MPAIERLGPGHERRGFECGDPVLDRFLLQFASQHDERGYGRTYVLTDGSPEILGFYTLSAGSVSLGSLSEEILRKPPRHPMPVVHLGRLAVARSAQGKGWGGILLVDALRRALLIAESLGTHAVEVVAKDEHAMRFYLKYGFKPLADDPLRLYLPIKTVRKLDL